MPAPASPAARLLRRREGRSRPRVIPVGGRRSFPTKRRRGAGRSRSWTSGQARRSARPCGRTCASCLRASAPTDGASWWPRRTRRRRCGTSGREKPSANPCVTRKRSAASSGAPTVSGSSRRRTTGRRGYGMHEPVWPSGGRSTTRVAVQAAECSPDGQRMVTASADGTARLWDVPTASASDYEGALRLAEAVAGFDETGKSLSTRQAFERLSRLREAGSPREARMDGLAAVTSWFLADPTSGRSHRFPGRRRPSRGCEPPVDNT